MSQTITARHIQESMSYEQYKALTDKLLLQNKTTGDNHSPDMIAYTQLNMTRMRRLDKTVHLQEALVTAINQVSKPWFWVVLTEAWCGDAAQNLPVIAKMAAQSPHITLRLLLRDEHPEVMDAYLTAGSRSIPKLVCLDEHLQEIGTWGPRPAPARQMVRDFKARPDGSYSDFVARVQSWYAKDKTQTMQQEFIQIVKAWNRENQSAHL